MAGNYSELKQYIDGRIRTNGNQQITGSVLNATLNYMVDTLGGHSTFVGFANPETDPGTYDADVFYLATEPGTYTNFGNRVLSPGFVAVLRNSTGSWVMTTAPVVGARTDDGGEIFNDYTNNTAGYRSRSSGYRNKVTASYASADGANHTVSGQYANVCGIGNKVTESGVASHTEGSNNQTTGKNGHTEGASNVNNSESGHVEGFKNIVQNDCEHAEGRYNSSHTGNSTAEKTRHSIGIGLTESGRKNAVEVMENGDVYIIGVGDYDGTNPGSRKTLQHIVNKIPQLLRDLGKYATELSVALSVGKSGKYVDSEGQEKTNSSMSISAPVQLKAGNVYLFPSSNAVGTGVSLFARQVTRTYDKVIVYATLEEDSEGRPTKIQADYDESLVYTVTYDGEGNASYSDASGSPVESLPATHQVTESFYEPLFRTNDTSMPESGYYLLLCTQDMEIVVSAASSDITGKNLLGVRYGVFASIATNFVGSPGQKVIAQAFAELYAAVQALSSVVDNAGHLKADVLDIANLPKVCGEDMYLTGEGAPAAPPTVPFQEYYDSSNNKFYRAKGVLPDTPSTGDWVALN